MREIIHILSWKFLGLMEFNQCHLGGQVALEYEAGTVHSSAPSSLLDHVASFSDANGTS